MIQIERRGKKYFLVEYTARPDGVGVVEKLRSGGFKKIGQARKMLKGILDGQKNSQNERDEYNDYLSGRFEDFYKDHEIIIPVFPPFISKDRSDL